MKSRTTFLFQDGILKRNGKICRLQVNEILRIKHMAGGLNMKSPLEQHLERELFGMLDGVALDLARLLCNDDEIHTYQ